jgi:hypothetical protein
MSRHDSIPSIGISVPSIAVVPAGGTPQLIPFVPVSHVAPSVVSTAATLPDIRLVESDAPPDAGVNNANEIAFLGGARQAPGSTVHAAPAPADRQARCAIAVLHLAAALAKLGMQSASLPGADTPPQASFAHAAWSPPQLAIPLLVAVAELRALLPLVNFAAGDGGDTPLPKSLPAVTPRKRLTPTSSRGSYSDEDSDAASETSSTPMAKNNSHFALRPLETALPPHEAWNVARAHVDSFGTVAIQDACASLLLLVHKLTTARFSTSFAAAVPDRQTSFVTTMTGFVAEVATALRSASGAVPHEDSPFGARSGGIESTQQSLRWRP